MQRSSASKVKVDCAGVGKSERQLGKRVCSGLNVSMVALKRPAKRTVGVLATVMSSASWRPHRPSAPCRCLRCSTIAEIRQPSTSSSAASADLSRSFGWRVCAIGLWDCSGSCDKRARSDVLSDADPSTCRSLWRIRSTAELIPSVAARRTAGILPKAESRKDYLQSHQSGTRRGKAPGHHCQPARIICFPLHAFTVTTRGDGIFDPLEDRNCSTRCATQHHSATPSLK